MESEMAPIESFRYLDVLTSLARLRSSHELKKQSQLAWTYEMHEALARGLHKFGWGSWRQIKAGQPLIRLFTVGQVASAASRLRDQREFSDLLDWGGA
jgi:hypothetical protein